MKRNLFVLLVVAIVFIFSMGCIQKQAEGVVHTLQSLGQEGSILNEDAAFEIMEYEYLDLRTLVVKASELTSRFEKDNYSIQVGDQRFPLEANPFNTDLRMANIPDSYSKEEILKGKLFDSLGETSVATAERSVGIGGVVIVHTCEECPNCGNDRFRIELLLFTQMRSAGIFVFCNGVFVTPTWIYSTEDKDYLLNEFVQARSAANGSIPGAFALLDQNEREQVIAPAPCVVTFEGGQLVFTCPGGRRLRDLGSEFPATDWVYQIIDNRPLGFWTVDIRKDRLPEDLRDADGWCLEHEEQLFGFVRNQFDPNMYGTNIPDSVTNNPEVIRDMLFNTSDNGGGDDHTICVIIEPQNGGQVRINGTWGGTRCVTVPAGTQVTLEARANTGYTWVGWYDGTTMISTNLVFQVTATGDKTYTARFNSTGTGQNRGLTIGASDYGGNGDLPGTIKDSARVKEVFERLSEAFVMQRQTGSMSKSEVIGWLNSYIAGSTAADVFVFHYSGHGGFSGGQSFLALPDGSISMNELRTELNKINGTKIVLIDACNSGGFANLVPGTEMRPDSLRAAAEAFVDGVIVAFDEDPAKRGSFQSNYEYYVIASAATSEYAWEVSTLGGIMPFTLTDGLGHSGLSNPSGAFNNSYSADGYGPGGTVDNSIRYRELYHYTKDLTQTIANSFGEVQTVQGNHIHDTFVVGTYSGSGPGEDIITWGEFGVTAAPFADNSNWDNIVNDLFGSEYRVADWNDLKAFYQNGGDLIALYNGLGLTAHGASAFVKRNGIPNFSSTRYYFASRHEGNVPPTYLVHDHINNHQISLGSWSGSRMIMAVKNSTSAHQAIQNGETKGWLDGSQGSERYYVLRDVPAGESLLKFVLWGGENTTGDADIFVKRGSLPTPSNYDYRSISSGNDEEIEISNPGSGNWYILVYGYSAYTQVALWTYHWRPIANNQTISNLSAQQGRIRYFWMNVPQGATQLRVNTWGGTGDADLYIRRGQLPWFCEGCYDYRSWAVGNTEEIVVNNPQPGTWVFMIHAYEAYSGASLKAEISGGSSGRGPSLAPTLDWIRPERGITGFNDILLKD